MVLHAFGGCDTTSAIFGHGKGTVFSKLSGNKSLSADIETLQNPAAQPDNVVQAGLHLMLALYGGKQTDTPGSLRYAAYSKMISKSLSRLQPERLPPSERVTCFHALRVHFQAVTWKTLGVYSADATLWGWRLDGKELVPITTDQAIAPDDIMNIIRCKCKTDCSSSQCSCRKNNLKCVSACGNCHGTDCTNVEPVAYDVESDDDGGLADIMLDKDLDCLDEEIVECDDQMQVTEAV